MTTQTPQSLTALCEYLGHPDHCFVRSECSDPSVPAVANPLMYYGYARGGIWFLDAQNRDVFLPVACGKTHSETGIRFLPDHFEATKFGLVIRYYYAEPPADDLAPPT